MQIPLEDLQKYLPYIYQHHASQGSLNGFYELGKIAAEHGYIDGIYFLLLYQAALKLDQAEAIEQLAAAIVAQHKHSPLQTYAQLVVAHAHLRRGNYHDAALTDPLRSWYHGLNYNIN